MAKIEASMDDEERRQPWEIYNSHPFPFDNLPSIGAYEKLPEEEQKRTIEEMEAMAEQREEELQKQIQRLTDEVHSNEEIHWQSQGLLDEEQFIHLYSLPRVERKEWLKDHEKRLEALTDFERLKLQAKAALNHVLEPLPTKFRSAQEYYVDFAVTVSD